jgi:hypothetical protein
MTSPTSAPRLPSKVILPKPLPGSPRTKRKLIASGYVPNVPKGYRNDCVIDHFYPI